MLSHSCHPNMFYSCSLNVLLFRTYSHRTASTFGCYYLSFSRKDMKQWSFINMLVECYAASSVYIRHEINIFHVRLWPYRLFVFINICYYYIQLFCRCSFILTYIIFKVEFCCVYHKNISLMLLRVEKVLSKSALMDF